MSLQIWLPLDGSLRNLGIASATISLTGATANTSGKIGSCFLFDGSDDLISINCPQLYQIFKGGMQCFSIAFWIYHNDTTRAIIFGDYGLSGSISFNIELTTTHLIRFYWAGSPDKNFNATSSVESLTWTHIVLTYDGNKINLYKNGALLSDLYTGTLSSKNKTSGLFYLGRDNRTGTTVLNGRLNDFRIYDHCLSAAEVKKIARGLVLHYKLDDLTNGAVDSSGYGHHANSNGSANPTIDTDTPRYSHSVKFTSGARISTPVATSTFLPRHLITVSIWFKTAQNPHKRFVSCTESGGWNFEDSGGYVLFPLYISGNNYTHCKSSTLTWSSLADNLWHMLSATYDRTYSKLYIDGQLNTTTSSKYPNIDIGYNASTPLAVGAEALTIASPLAGTYVGNLSDLRIYGTPLSEEDILQLYQLGAKVDNELNIHTYELNENNTNKLTKTGILYNNIIEPFLILPDGSKWLLLLYHWVNNGSNLFTSSTAAYCNGPGLYSRLLYIDNFIYNNKYEFYVIQDDITHRWSLTNAPLTTTSVSGFTSISGSPSSGICKCNGNTLLARTGTTSNWWNAAGCYKKYLTGIPGFGNNVICKKYLALYARVENYNAKIANLSAYASEFIEF